MNVEVDPADDIGDVFEGAPTKKTVHVLVVVPSPDETTQRLQQLQRPVSQVMDDEVNERPRKRQKVICVERDTLLLGTAKALLEQIKGFDMDLAELNSVLDVPFPSL
ncbi:hypothetical protein L914_04573 [Phytophthora nicotianae]|uniref:Uncharacterized protein n=1 Tax=Phytophthora nicotianae TaxID=4792 RepID=W2NUH9_PHYNI|nr:hypothetical protein L914_04573 [Phytophthora nicotianae]